MWDVPTSGLERAWNGLQPRLERKEVKFIEVTIRCTCFPSSTIPHLHERHVHYMLRQATPFPMQQLSGQCLWLGLATKYSAGRNALHCRNTGSGDWEPLPQLRLVRLSAAALHLPSLLKSRQLCLPMNL